MDVSGAICPGVCTCSPDLGYVWGGLESLNALIGRICIVFCGAKRRGDCSGGGCVING